MAVLTGLQVEEGEEVGLLPGQGMRQMTMVAGEALQGQVLALVRPGMLRVREAEVVGDQLGILDIVLILWG